MSSCLRRAQYAAYATNVNAELPAQQTQATLSLCRGGRRPSGRWWASRRSGCAPSSAATTLTARPPSPTSGAATPAASRSSTQRSRRSCGRRWAPRARRGDLDLPERGGVDGRTAGAAGERAARLGVDAATGVHPATPPPARGARRPGGAGGAQKGGLQAAIDAVAAAHPGAAVEAWAVDEHRLGLLPVVRRDRRDPPVSSRPHGVIRRERVCSSPISPVPRPRFTHGLVLKWRCRPARRYGILAAQLDAKGPFRVHVTRNCTATSSSNLDAETGPIPALGVGSPFLMTQGRTESGAEGVTPGGVVTQNSREDGAR